MSASKENHNNSELIDLIESAEMIAATGGLMETDLSTHIGAYEPLAVPIIKGFWSQADALSALLDYLHENPINYSSHVPLLFVKSLRAFNSTQQHSCSGALIVGHESLHGGGHLNICTIIKAMTLSVELGFLLKGIERALVKKGFKCK